MQEVSAARRSCLSPVYISHAEISVATSRLAVIILSNKGKVLVVSEHMITFVISVEFFKAIAEFPVDLKIDNAPCQRF